MATIHELVDKLRAGEEVVIHNKYQFTVMQQIEDHGSEIGYLKPVKFERYDNNHTRLTLEQ